MRGQARNFGLDVMRALAALMVASNHLSNFVASSFLRNPVFLRYFRGFWGVELFFVLSGFLIGGILLRDIRSGRLFKPGGLSSFWRRRWYRTLPNYYLFFAINLAVDHQRFPITLLLPFLAFCQHIAIAKAEFFLGSWSLAVEEWFYLLFPLTIVALSKAGSRRALGGAVAILASLTLLASVLVPWQRDIYGFDSGFRIIPWLRMNSILFGVVLAWTHLERPKIWQTMTRFRLLLCLPLLLWIEVSLRDEPDGWYLHSWAAEAAFLPLTSFFCALLLPFFASLKPGPPWLTRIVTRLSVISYSLYLCHIPVSRVMVYTTDQLGIARGNLYFAVTLLLAIACSELIYRFWEAPWLARRDGIKGSFRLRTAP